MSIAKQIILILAAALCLGSVANVLSPYRIPWSQDWSNRIADAARAAGLTVVDVHETKRRADDGSAMILDARPLTQYGEGHIPGAFSCPVETLEQSLPETLPMLIPDLPVLVYCTGKECDESMTLGTRLLSEGITNVLIFVGGYAEWQTASAEAAQ